MPRTHNRGSVPGELPIIAIARLLPLQKRSLRRRKVFLQQHKQIRRHIAIVDVVTMPHQALINPAAIDRFDAVNDQRNDGITGPLLRMNPLGHDER